MNSLVSPPLEFTPKSVSQQVYSYLREAIITGVLKPNQRLTEELLSNELNVSRTPIREALFRLEVEGLIVNVPNKGAVVRSDSLEEIAQIYDVRSILEGYGARLAAMLIEPSIITNLEDICDSFETVLGQAREQLEQVKELVKLDDRFHITILEASGNETLINVTKMVRARPLTSRAYYWYKDQHKKISLNYHKKILFSLSNKNPAESESLMKEHILNSKALLLEKDLVKEFLDE